MARDWRRFLLIGCLLAAARPASALDCGKAATAAEQAICADPTARAADEAMAAAFAARLAAESPAARPTLVSAQALWLRDRDFACADAKSACLAEQSARRRAFLAAEPEAGPGAPGRLAPVLRIEAGGKRKAAIDVQLLKYPSPATPAERAFNAAVDKIVGPLDQPEDGDPAADRFAYDRTMRLTFASPSFLSAHLDAFNDTGGAHPTTYSGNVNIDVAGDRELEFADLVDAKGAKSMFAICLKQVVAQKKARLGAEVRLGPDDLKTLADDIRQQTGQLGTWSFGASEATVAYDPYAVGAYVEGAYACVLPYAQLKPLAKQSFPLPEG